MQSTQVVYKVMIGNPHFTKPIWQRIIVFEGFRQEDIPNGTWLDSIKLEDLIKEQALEDESYEDYIIGQTKFRKYEKKIY